MAAKENKGAGKDAKAKPNGVQEITTAEVNDDGEDEVVNPAGDGEQDEPLEPEIKLYKSTRIKGYLTLIVASVINFDSAQKSEDVKSTNAVASTIEQRRYAISVSLVSLILSSAILLMHLDRITMFKKAWTTAFQPKSKIELGLALFQVIWWSVAVGVETSVQGIAGDGKGQYSLYYSSWGCCLTSYWILERWWVAAGWSSLKSFIRSWPYRAPGWILILFLSIFTLVWYVDLWQNHGGESSPVEIVFKNVSEGQWQWLTIIATFTVIPAVVFVLIELFRETKADGSNEEKGQVENILEGFLLLILVMSWIPTTMLATTPGGAASLIGNAYFFTWLLVIVILEAFVWFVHDQRKRLHLALKEKANEYHNKQREVLQKSRELQRRQEFEDNDAFDDTERELEQDVTEPAE